MKKNRIENRLTVPSVGLLLLAATSVAYSQETTNSIPNRLPPIVVTGSQPAENRPGWLKEEQLVGPYEQPEWTTARRFPGTRVYLQQQPWNMGVEQWVRFQHFRDGTSYTRFQEEFEIGLPHRFQLDFYETWGINQDWWAQQSEWSAEVRYALADWGKIPLNPTLYLEYSQHDNEPNALEGKLLLGTDLTSRWHWGLNLAVEQQLGNPNNTEIAVSQGFSYTLIDEKLGVGVEMAYYHEKADDSGSQQQFLIGPSAQWRVTPRLHVDVAPLFGCTHDSPNIQAYLVIGFDLGSAKSERYAPASVRGQQR